MDKHKIPGLVWYDKDEKRIINYVNGLFEMMKIGVSQFVEDSLYQFNNVDLSPKVKTIHEVLDFKRGKSSSRKIKIATRLFEQVAIFYSLKIIYSKTYFIKHDGYGVRHQKRTFVYL